MFGSLARAIGEGHRLYTRMVNFHQGARGYLFQGRFFSCSLDEDYLYACLRYVERNPVRVIKGVKHAWDYEWSSARFHVGLTDSDPLVREHELLESIDNWRLFLEKETDELDFLRKKTRTGRPCGSNVSREKAELITDRILRPRKPGPKPASKE